MKGNTKERQNMKSLNKKAKALFATLSFAAYLPLSMLPTMAATIDANTTPELSSSINGGSVGLNGTIVTPTGETKNNFEVNLAPGLGAGGTAIFNWGKFNVGSNVAVNWVVNNARQTAVNRVLNSGGMSKIYGTLMSSCSATGCNYQDTANIILINPNGILFGSGSNVNLNSFTASTFDIKGKDGNFSIGADGQYGLADMVPGTGSNYTSTLLNTYFKNALDARNSDFTFQGNDYLVDADGNGWIGGAPVTSGTVAEIKLDGANFNTQADTKAKTVAFVGNKINVTGGSKINTYIAPADTVTGNYSYTSAGATQYATRSNVKLITSDGVTFTYSNLGDISDPINASSVRSKTGDATYGINIDNASDINTGNVHIANTVENGNITIKNIEKIQGNKMYNGVPGAVTIESAGNIDIDNSRINSTVRYSDDDTNIALSKAGDVDITAGKAVTIKNSFIRAIDSKSNGSATSADDFVGNLTISGGTGVTITNTEASSLTPSGITRPNNLLSGGNLTIQSGGDVKIELQDNKIQALGDATNANAKKTKLSITGDNVEINKARVIGGDVTILAGDVVSGAVVGGGIKTDGSTLFSYSDLTVKGFNTTLKDTLLSYDKDLIFDNGYTSTATANLGNNVKILGTTTIFDELLETAGSGRDELTITTNGELIVDNNKLQKKAYSETTSTSTLNQNHTINLVSTQNQVSVINGSNIKTDNGNIVLNGKTNANVSNSDLTTAAGNISITGGKQVTIGNRFEDATAGTGAGSKLSSSGNISLTTTDADGNGIAILGSELRANGGKSTITSANSDVIIAENGKVISEHGNNVINITNGKLLANNATITAKDVNTESDGLGGTVVTNSNVLINQSGTMNLDSDLTGTTSITSEKGNIKVTVNGAGNDIVANGSGDSLDRFTYSNGRLQLKAADEISLASSGSWNIDRTDVEAANGTTINARGGNVTINGSTTDAIGLGLGFTGDRTTGTTKIIASGNVKTGQNTAATTGSGIISGNHNKLSVDAGRLTDITFEGIDTKGIEVNAGVDTRTYALANTNLDGRDVKLTARDNKLAVSKIKANTLALLGSDNNALNTRNITAAGTTMTALENTSALSSTAVNAKDAYIEVNTVNGFNLDPNTSDISTIPDFYNSVQNYDAVTDTTTFRKHFINFDGSQNPSTTNTLLVYQRGISCGIDEEPSITGGGANTTSTFAVGVGVNESTFVRMPRPTEGTSLLAPVTNLVTDPTSNVIMAAARLTVSPTSTASEEDDGY